MRMVIPLTAAAMLTAATATATALPIAPAGISRGEPAIVLVQDKPKKGESLKTKVKRAWKNLVGYHFDVSCFGDRRSCAETGKDEGDALNKCIARNPLCWVESKK